MAHIDTDSLLAHHNPKGGFRNVQPEAYDHLPHNPLWFAIRWLTVGVPPDPGFDATVPADFSYPNPHDPVDNGQPTVTWIGHDTFLLELEGVRILTDPVFGEYASPIHLSASKRQHCLDMTLAQVGHVDAVLVSHNHYDHLERATVIALADHVLWFVPLGLKAWFAGEGVHNVIELDWWESAELRPGMHVTLTPAQHFSSRGLFDRDQTLWGGWVLRGKTRRVYFAGDTGYNSIDFQEIGVRLGPFDLAMLPIGTYEPRSFMKMRHADPADAVQIHRDIRSRLSVAMHWGSFILSVEPPMQPPWRLFQALQAVGEPIEHFRVLDHGQSLNF